MSFAATMAGAKLLAKLKALNEVFPEAAMELQNAHLYSDALVAVSQANGCRLEAAARAMALLGMTRQDVSDAARRWIETPATRLRYYDAVGEMLHLTEELVAQALQENCGCQGGDQPAPLIGDMLRT